MQIIGTGQDFEFDTSQNSEHAVYCELLCWLAGRIQFRATRHSHAEQLGSQDPPFSAYRESGKSIFHRRSAEQNGSGAVANFNAVYRLPRDAETFKRVTGRRCQ